MSVHMPQRKTYSSEFKIEAVRLVTDENRPLKQVSRELGVDASTLRHWVGQLSREGDNAFPGKGNVHDEELRRLKRELEMVQMERDILKKAVGIFSQMPRK